MWNLYVGAIKSNFVMHCHEVLAPQLVAHNWWVQMAALQSGHNWCQAVLQMVGLQGGRERLWRHTSCRGILASAIAAEAGRAPVQGIPMSVDAATVRRIAHLARIAVADDEVEHLRGEINSILAFVEQLSEVNVEGVEAMTSVMPMAMKKRADVVTDGGDADAVLRNAPAREGNYYVVPKVVE
jgi:aspartyl-tRNA(Asn)/glutamyl-tRNA(Gln) amidotransferase subunit C